MIEMDWPYSKNTSYGINIFLESYDLAENINDYMKFHFTRIFFSSQYHHNVCMKVDISSKTRHFLKLFHEIRIFSIKKS